MTGFGSAETLSRWLDAHALAVSFLIPWLPVVSFGAIRLCQRWLGRQTEAADDASRFAIPRNPFETLRLGHPGSPCLAWLMIGAIVGSASAPFVQPTVPASSAWNERVGHALVAAGLGLVPATIILLYRTLVAWVPVTAHFVGFASGDARAWWNRELHLLWKRPGLVLGGVVATLLAVVGCLQRPSGLSLLGRVVNGVVTTPSVAIVGIALVLLTRLTLLVVRLGRLELTHLDGPRGAVSVGGVVLRIWFGATLLYALYTSTALFYGRGHPARDPALLLLGLPAGLILLAGFVGCQWTLHRGMVEHKRRRLLELDQKIGELETRLDGGTEPDLLERCETMYTRRDRISQLPEWPYSGGQLLVAFGSTLFSMAPTVLDLLSKS